MPVANLTASRLVPLAPVLGSPTPYYFSILTATNLIIPTPMLRRPKATHFYPWDMRVNWQNGMVEEIAFRTEIIVSRNGVEQRRAQRVNPRYSFRWDVRVAHDKAAKLERLLGRRQAHNYRFAHPRAGTLAERLHPAAGGFIGRFTREAAVTSRTDRITEMEVSVMALPGVYGGDLAFGNVYPDATQFHNGLEVFPLRPNWANPVKLTFAQKVEMFDLQRGVTDFNTPEAFTTRMVQCGFMVRNRTQEEALLGWWHRAKGQQKEFYLIDPLTAQVVPTANIPFNANNLTVSGPELFVRFGGEAIYRNIAIRTKTLGTIYRRVTSINLNAGNSRISLASPLPAIPLSEIVGVHWLLKARSAVDTMILNWETDVVAQTTLTFRALEDTP